jgi:hypothetical protein
MTIEKLCVDPLAKMVTLPVPGFVREPIFQVHEQVPLPSAVFGIKPCATLYVPFEVTYEMGQLAPSTFWIVAEAFPFTCVGYPFDPPAFRPLAG